MASLNVVLTYSKQHYFLSVIKRFYAKPVYPLKHVELIKNITATPEEEVISYLRNNLDLQNMPEDELSDKLSKLDALNLRDKRTLDRMILLKHHPKTIKHRYLIFKELGVTPHKITSTNLSKYLTLIKMKVSLLKKKKLLDQDVDVVENILSSTPLNSSHIDRSLSESLTADEIKIYFLRKLLIHVVGFTEPFEEESKILRRLRHKSLAETMRNLSVLQHDVGIPLEKIRSNPFLLSAADPDNTLEIMSTFPTIAGVNIRTILFNHPKILASCIQNIIKIHQYLKEAGITDEALSKCFEVFTLNCETVRSRLNECHNDKFLSVCRHHPRVLELIIYQKKAKQRLDKLKQISVDLVSLSILASSDKNFNKYLNRGSEKYHGMDSVYYLAEELSCKREILRSKLQKHPHWIYVSLLTISTNLQALRSRGFTEQEIINEICILLYPTKLVADEVDKVPLRQETNECRDENGLLKRSCILPLALYYMERGGNFTGSAIWSSDNFSEDSPLYARRLDLDFPPDRSAVPSTAS